MAGPYNRRDFGKTAITAAAVATGATRGVLGANERIRIGCLGVGNRGCQLLSALQGQPDAEVVALCDVYEPYLHGAYDRVDPRYRDLGSRIPRQPVFGPEVAREKDFRRLLDRKDIDAVIVATPDHWHAIQSIAACDAGKDVYVEKPLSITIREGRRMVEAARRNQRIVQVGTHRRSSRLYERLAEVVRSGKLGKVTVARSYLLNNMAPDGIGVAPDSDPPEGLDWDFWLGPRPARPFNKNIAPYKFRWWHLYSSQMANWGVHYLDAIRWVAGETAPASVSAHGGRFALHDSRTVPDTAEAVFEHASGMLTIFGQYEASGNPALRSGEIEIRGTLGTVYADIEGYEVVPEVGGQFQRGGPRMEAIRVQATDGDLDRQHVRNFLDCVKSRNRPHADVEDGHRSTTFALLANIALATKARLEWDAQAERITNHDAANELLHYEYRKPWKLA